MIKGLREKDFIFCQYDIIEISLYLNDILEKKYGYDYDSLFTKRSKHDTEYEKKSNDFVKVYRFSSNTFDEIKNIIKLNNEKESYDKKELYDKNEKIKFHEIKKESKFYKAFNKIEKTILKSGENYIEMKQKKEKSILNQEEDKEFTHIQSFWQSEILCSLYIKMKIKRQIIEENKKKNKREKMSIYSLEECIFFLVILLSPTIRNSIKWKEKKNKTRISYEKKESEETLRFMEMVENATEALNMVLYLLPIIFEDPIFKDSTLQKKKRKGELNISKNYINRCVDKNDILDAVYNLFELANLKNTIEIFWD